ncbi:unnamed protein product, partial [Prorocentrum cordatum]
SGGQLPRRSCRWAQWCATGCSSRPAGGRAQGRHPGAPRRWPRCCRWSLGPPRWCCDTAAGRWTTWASPPSLSGGVLAAAGS